MKKQLRRVLAMLLTTSMVMGSGVTSLAEDAAADNKTPTVIAPVLDEQEFYANGIPVKISSDSEAGETDGAFITWEAGSSEDGDLAWEAGQMKVNSGTIVYGGSKSGETLDTSVVMDGGTVGKIYGGGQEDKIENTSVVLNGGTVVNEVFAGGVASEIDKTNVEITAAKNENEDEDKAAFIAEKGIYLGNDSSNTVEKEANVVVKNGSNAENAAYTSGINVMTYYELKEEQDGEEVVVKTGDVGEDAKVTVTFDEYAGEYLGTIPESVDEILAAEGSSVVLPAEMKEALEGKVKSEDVTFEEASEEVIPEMDDSGIVNALSLEEFLAPYAAEDEEPAAGEDGHVHVGERLYLVDLYSDVNTTLSYVVAYFFENEPTFDEAGIPSAEGKVYKQYMTKNGSYYGVKIPKHEDAVNLNNPDRPAYKWFAVVPYRNDGSVLEHIRSYNFIKEGTGNDYTSEHIRFDFEAGVKDAVYTGRNGNSYIDAHPSAMDESLAGEILYFNFDNMPAGMKAEPFYDSESGKDYYEISWTSGNTTETRRITEKVRNGDTWYYIFQPNDNVTESTIFTLRDKNYEKTGGLRFVFSRQSPENMLLVGGLLSNGNAWGVYKTVITGNWVVSVNNFLADLTDIKIEYTTRENGNRGWSEVKVQSPSDQFPNIYGTDTVPKDAVWIRITGKHDGDTYSTGAIKISESEMMNYDYPCLYAIRKIEDGEYKLAGTWKSAYAKMTTGDEVQNIESGTYQRNNEAYYATVDMYDYYSKTEQLGIALSEDKYDYNDAGSVFNTALKAYYDENGITGPNGIYFGGVADSLINAGIKDGADSKYYANNIYVGDTYVTTDMVNSSLKSGNTLTMGDGKTEVPFFNRDFIRGNNSLNMALGQVYNNVTFPFEKNEEGYWEFDSKNPEDSVVLKKDQNQGYYLEIRPEGQAVENPKWGTSSAAPNSSQYGFYPFDSYVDGWTNTSDEVDLYRRNFLSGVQMNLPFSITESGTIQVEASGNQTREEDITFEFEGDDDVWIYIDGKLVLDLGGAHGTLGGTINFRTGEVLYKGSYTQQGVDQQVDQTSSNAGNLKDITLENGENLLAALKDGENHTLTMYYLERGQSDSNMKVVFNFPVQSKFTVTNTINTDGADPIFDEALENMGGFNFKLYNQAVSGDSLAVEDAKGYVTAGSHTVLNDGTSGVSIVQEDGEVVTAEAGASPGTSDGITAIHYRAKNSVGTWNADDAEERMISIDIPKTRINSRNNPYVYLRMDVWSEIASTLGYEMYIRLTGTDRENRGSTYTVEGPASEFMYNNNNNTLHAGAWNSVRIDLAEAKSKGINYLTKVEFAFSKEADIYIDDIRLYEKMNENVATGFIVDQDEISDYGSIASGSLRPAADADFRLYNGLDSSTETDGAIGAVSSQGMFTLADAQKVVFNDKFRAGSYIHLYEAIIDGDGKVFKSTYSVSEMGEDNTYEVIPKGELVPGRNDTTTIENSSEVLELGNIKGRTVSDGRTSIVNGNEVTANYNDLGKVDGENETSIVYRRYDNPDMVEGKGIDIKVDYVNQLRMGAIQIDKVIDYDDFADVYKAQGLTEEAFVNALDGDTVTFRVFFTNVANRWLENYTGETIYKDVAVTLHRDTANEGRLVASGTIENIPAGTEYKIVEIPTVGTGLHNIEVGNNSVGEGGDAHTDVGVVLGEKSDEDSSGRIYESGYAVGKVYESTQIFTFTDVVPSVDGLTVQKFWNNLPDDKTEETAEVTVYLEYREVGSETWKTVVDEDGNRVEKTIIGNTGKAYFENLPLFTTGSTEDTVKKLEYRVREVVPEGFVPIYNITEEGVYTITNTATGAEYYVWEDHDTVLELDAYQGINQNRYEVTFLQDDKEIEDGRLWIAGNKVHVQSPKTGAESYTIRLTPKYGGSTEDISITVYTYDMDSDIYVLDYGLPAKFADHTKPGQTSVDTDQEKILKDGLFEDDTYKVTESDTVTNEFVGIADVDSEGNVSSYEDIIESEGHNGRINVVRTDLTKDSKDYTGADVIFTPTKFMDQVDTYSYKTIIRKAGTNNVESDINSSNGVVMHEQFKVMPASVVYYDDSFGNTSEGTTDTNVSGIVYSGSYDMTIKNADHYQSIDSDEAYGHDDVFNDVDGTNPGQTDALGGSTTISWDGQDTINVGTASFKFKGTGFDVVGRTDKQSIQVTYIIRDANNKPVKRGTVDTVYEGETGLYQLPVIGVHDLSYGEYNVTINARYRETGDGTLGVFYMDGVRIYNPLGDDTSDYNAKEQNAEVLSVREMILGSKTLADQGTIDPGTTLEGAKAALVYSDGLTAANTYELGSTSTEVPGVGTSAVSTSNLNDYLVLGPKGEMYLPKGSAIAFYALDNNPSSNDKTLQIEAKAVSTEGSTEEYPTLISVKESSASTELQKSKIKINSSTAMYYEVNLNDCKQAAQDTYLVILANNSDTDISLTNLKTKGYTISYPTSGIQDMASTEVDEAVKNNISNGYNGYLKAQKYTTTELVEVIDASFAMPFVNKGNSAYLNVTLKMENSAYHPFILRYENDKLTSMEEGTVDPDTLNPIHDYQDEEGNTYFVFKVKVTFDEKIYTMSDYQYFFAVGAESNSGFEASTDCKAVSIWSRGAGWTPTVTLSNTEMTAQDVVATLNVEEPVQDIEGWEKQDEKSYTRTFSENGTYEVSVESMGGYKETVSFTIANIDKIPPTAEVILTDIEDGKVTANLFADEEIRAIEEWTKVDEKTYTKVYTEEGSKSVVITDKAGNETTVQFNVTGIKSDVEEDKNSPEHNQSHFGGFFQKAVESVSNFFSNAFKKFSKWF